jgi:NTP pyrophosphatase (non-canonical NTP hydrolase)
MIDNTTSVFVEVEKQRDFQDEKWGQQDHDPLVWLAILMEEVGEVAEAIVRGHQTMIQDYRTELLQVAAVAVAAVEAWDRQCDSADVAHGWVPGKYLGTVQIPHTERPLDES